MHNMSQRNSRIARTMAELSEYDFEVRYRAGKDNKIADTLSRLHETPVSLPSQVPPALPDGLSVLTIVEGGGDSLPKSLFAVLQQHKGLYNPMLEIPKDHANLRLVIVGEVLNNLPVYGLPSNRETKNRLKLTELPGELMGDWACKAFAKIFNLDVWVHHGMRYPVIHTAQECLGPDSTKRVHLQCISGVHYNPLSEYRSYSPKLEPCQERPLLPTLIEEDSDETDNLQVTFAVTKSEASSCSHDLEYTVIVIECNNHYLCALFDSGAQINLIGRKALESLNLPNHTMEPCQSPVGIKSVGNSKLVAECVVELKLTINGILYDPPVPFAVVDESSMPYCAILGANMLRKLNAVMNFKQKIIHLNVLGQQISIDMPRQTQDVEPVGYCLVQELLEPSFPRATAGLNHAQAVELQARDPVIRNLYSMVQDHHPPPLWRDGALTRFRHHAQFLCTLDNLLWYKTSSDLKLVVPFHFLVEMGLAMHYKRAHPGRNKLIKMLQSVLWHPSLTKVAQDVCYSCELCQKFKIGTQLVHPPMLKIVAPKPFELVATDLIQLPPSRTGHIGCLVCVDHGSKWIAAVPIRNKNLTI